MRLSHLALAVRDQARSRRFYETYFGFDAASAQRHPDGVLILRNADGFDLALGPGATHELPAGYFHLGFRVAPPERVRVVQARLAADGIAVVEVRDEPALVSVKCRDPDGYLVEVYREQTPASSTAPES